jgi:transcription termination/antitermination protein NusG
MVQEKKWFVFYTKSRHEKKVYEILQRADHEVFLPLQKVVKQWSDRKKKVEIPLFNSYIFVKTFEHNLALIRETPGISWIIKYDGKPAVLWDQEYETIRRFVTSGLHLETCSIDTTFLPGDKAKVIDGPLAGMSGFLSGGGNQQKLNVILEGIHQVIRVEIEGSLLKRID